MELSVVGCAPAEQHSGGLYPRTSRGHCTNLIKGKDCSTLWDIKDRDIPASCLPTFHSSSLAPTLAILMFERLGPAPGQPIWHISRFGACKHLSIGVGRFSTRTCCCCGYIDMAKVQPGNLQRWKGTRGTGLVFLNQIFSFRSKVVSFWFFKEKLTLTWR